MYPPICVRREAIAGNGRVLEIGSEEYNRIRYPSYGDRTPAWKTTLKRELRLKQENSWTYKKSPQTGCGFHPAKTSLRNDIMHCIATGIPLKTKSFEYRPLDDSIHLYGKYVGTYGEADLSSFTLRHINTKETRYRLKDFGINLISKKGKTYWRIIVACDYYEYLMQIYGSFAELKERVRPIFPTVILENSKEYAGTETPFYTLLCELHPEIEYPTLMPNAHSRYGVHSVINRFSHSSFILSTLAEQPDEGYSEPYKPTYYYKDWLEYSLGCALNIKDPESKKFNLGILFKAVFLQGRLIKKLYKDFSIIAGGFKNKFMFSLCGHLFTFDLIVKKLQIKDESDKVSEYDFVDLGISEYFTDDGIIIKPSCKEELLAVLKENSGIRMQIYHKNKDGYDLYLEILDVDRYITPLLGKELLLVC